MKSTFIPLKLKPAHVFTTIGKAYRSHSVHFSKVKHCFEGVFVDQVPSYIFGFSPIANGREFISVCMERGYGYQISQRRGLPDADVYVYNSSTPKEGDAVLACLDSENMKFYYITNDLRNNATFSAFSSYQEWYVYIDGSTLAGTDNIHVTVNLGSTPFQNQIPDGFYPWNYGIDAIRGLSFSIKCKKPRNITYLSILFLNSI